MNDVVMAPGLWKLDAIADGPKYFSDLEGSVSFGSNFLVVRQEKSVVFVPNVVSKFERWERLVYTESHAFRSQLMGVHCVLSPFL